MSQRRRREETLTARKKIIFSHSTVKPAVSCDINSPLSLSPIFFFSLACLCIDNDFAAYLLTIVWYSSHALTCIPFHFGRSSYACLFFTAYQLCDRGDRQKFAHEYDWFTSNCCKPSWKMCSALVPNDVRSSAQPSDHDGYIAGSGRAERAERQSQFEFVLR